MGQLPKHNAVMVRREGREIHYCVSADDALVVMRTLENLGKEGLCMLTAHLCDGALSELALIQLRDQARKACENQPEGADRLREVICRALCVLGEAAEAVLAYREYGWRGFSLSGGVIFNPSDERTR